jgi:hypothetical protein
MASELADCPAAADLEEAEVARFDAIPNAAHEVQVRNWCDLSDGHEGYYAAYVQGEENLPDVIEWWITWDDGGHREIKVYPHCPQMGTDTYGETVDCLKFAGHGGQHNFG